MSFFACCTSQNLHSFVHVNVKCYFSLLLACFSNNETLLAAPLAHFQTNSPPHFFVSVSPQALKRDSNTCGIAAYR